MPPAVFFIILRFLVSWLKRRLHQDEVNAFLEKEGDIQGVPWVEDVVEYLGMKLVIEGEENLPEEEPEKVVKEYTKKAILALNVFDTDTTTLEQLAYMLVDRKN